MFHFFSTGLNDKNYPLSIHGLEYQEKADSDKCKEDDEDCIDIPHEEDDEMNEDEDVVFEKKRNGPGYLFRSRRTDDNSLERFLRSPPGYLFRSRKAAGYLFRSRRGDTDDASFMKDPIIGMRSPKSYLFRTRKAIYDSTAPFAQRMNRGSYLFRTRKSDSTATRDRRSKYFFRTRKDEEDMARSLRAKGYLFRTRKSLSAVPRGGYLFRT